MIRWIKRHLGLLFIGLSIFIIGILVGSYVTKQSSSISEFLLNQRINLMIGILTGLFTGLLSGIVVSSYFDDIQKQIDAKEYTRTLGTKLLIIWRGINDFLFRDDGSILDEYLIKDRSVYLGFNRYRKYMSKEMFLIVKRAIESRKEYESAYRNIKAYLDAINDFEKRQNKENKRLIYPKIESYKKEIDEKKTILKESQKVIMDIHDEIFMKKEK